MSWKIGPLIGHHHHHHHHQLIIKLLLLLLLLLLLVLLLHHLHHHHLYHSRLPRLLVRQITRICISYTAQSRAGRSTGIVTTILAFPSLLFNG